MVCVSTWTVLKTKRSVSRVSTLAGCVTKSIFIVLSTGTSGGNGADASSVTLLPAELAWVLRRVDFDLHGKRSDESGIDGKGDRENGVELSESVHLLILSQDFLILRNPRLVDF